MHTNSHMQYGVCWEIPGVLSQRYSSRTLVTPRYLTAEAQCAPSCPDGSLLMPSCMLRPFPKTQSVVQKAVVGGRLHCSTITSKKADVPKPPHPPPPWSMSETTVSAREVALPHLQYDVSSYKIRLLWMGFGAGSLPCGARTIILHHGVIVGVMEEFGRMSLCCFSNVFQWLQLFCGTLFPFFSGCPTKNGPSPKKGSLFF